MLTKPNPNGVVAVITAVEAVGFKTTPDDPTLVDPYVQGAASEQLLKWLLASIVYTPQLNCNGSPVQVERSGKAPALVEKSGLPSTSSNTGYTQTLLAFSAAERNDFSSAFERSMKGFIAVDVTDTLVAPIS